MNPPGNFTLEYVNELAADAKKRFLQAKKTAPASRENYLQTLPTQSSKALSSGLRSNAGRVLSRAPSMAS